MATLPTYAQFTEPPETYTTWTIYVLISSQATFQYLEKYDCLALIYEAKRGILPVRSRENYRDMAQSESGSLTVKYRMPSGN